MDFLDKLFDTNLQNDIVKAAQNEIRENVSTFFGQNNVEQKQVTKSVYEQKEIDSVSSFDVSTLIMPAALVVGGFLAYKLLFKKGK
jgi:hypothetical protein